MESCFFPQVENRGDRDSLSGSTRASGVGMRANIAGALVTDIAKPLLLRLRRTGERLTLSCTPNLSPYAARSQRTNAKKL